MIVGLQRLVALRRDGPTRVGLRIPTLATRVAYAAEGLRELATLFLSTTVVPDASAVVLLPISSAVKAASMGRK